MKKSFYLFFFISLFSYSGVIKKSPEGLPKFEGFRANDFIKIKDFLKKDKLHKNAAFKVEVLCYPKKVKGSNMLIKNSSKTVCQYVDIKGFSGTFPNK